MKYLLLDIDGVYNPFLAPDLTERGFISYQSGWISWAIDLINHAQWLRDVENKVNIVWASSWAESSNELAAMFGLNNANLPHIELFNPPTDNGVSWKLPSIQKWLEENITEDDTIVWIDDEIHVDVTDTNVLPSNIHVIVPDPSIGLTREQWVDALNFLNVN